jgi:hypothetical protein
MIVTEKSSPPTPSGAIENLHQFAHRALQSLGEADQHRKARDLHAAFEIADERFIRLTAIRQLLLSQTAGRAECAQVRTENFALQAAL